MKVFVRFETILIKFLQLLSSIVEASSTSQPFSSTQTHIHKRVKSPVLL